MTAITSLDADYAYKPFERGALLRMEENRNKFSYWRYLGYWEPTDQIFLLRVEPNVRPSTRVPKAWRRDVLERRFGKTVIKVEDCVRLPSMKVPLKGLIHEDAQRIRAEVASRLAPIRYLVNEANFMTVVASKRIRAQMLKEAEMRSGVDEATLRRYLTIFWWFGCKKSGLRRLHEWKGGAGQSRSDYGRPKTGPRNALYKKSGLRLDLGIQCGGVHKGMIWRLVDKHVIEDDLSFPAAYQKAIETGFIARTRVKGVIVETPWDQRRIPSEYQFYRHGKQRVDANIEKKLGEKDAREKLGGKRGHASDLIVGSKLILIMDGTGLPVYLVLDTDTYTPIGQAYGTFALCLASGALTGLHIGPWPESTNTYRYTFFSACTSKDDLAKEYGLEPSIGLPKGTWDAIFVDRGPAVSESFVKTIAESVGMAHEMAEVYRGQAKGTIESFNAYLKKELAMIPGAYTRRIASRKQEEREKAKGKAVVTFRELCQCTLSAIIKFNLLSDASAYYTDDMRRASVPMNRAKICEHIQEIRRGGTKKSLSEERLFYTLLPYKPRKNDGGKIRMDKATYFSPVLKEHWRHTRSIRGGKVRNSMVEIAEVPWESNSVVWRKSDGSFQKIALSKHSERSTGGMVGFERRGANVIDLANKQDNARTHRRGPNAKVTVAKHQSLDTQAARRQKDTVPVTATTGLEDARKRFVEAATKEHGDRLAARFEPKASPPARSAPRPAAIDSISGTEVYEKPANLSARFRASFKR